MWVFFSDKIARTLKFSVSWKWKITENLHDDVEYRPTLQLGSRINPSVSMNEHATGLKHQAIKHSRTQKNNMGVLDTNCSECKLMKAHGSISYGGKKNRAPNKPKLQ